MMLMPVFFVNKSKFDSWMNAAAYMPTIYWHIAQAEHQIWKEEYYEKNSRKKWKIKSRNINRWY